MVRRASFDPEGANGDRAALWRSRKDRQILALGRSPESPRPSAKTLHTESVVSGHLPLRHCPCGLPNATRCAGTVYRWPSQRALTTRPSVKPRINSHGPPVVTTIESVPSALWRTGSGDDIVSRAFLARVLMLILSVLMFRSPSRD
jgi:hypothetical protein